MLVEQTTVAIIDTNGVSGGSNSLSGSSSTDVGNAAGSDFGSASDRSSPTSLTSTNSTDTNSVSSGTDQKQSSAFATPASDENSGAAASSESGQDSSKAPASQSDRLIDYQVLDATGKPVGTVEALWDDSNGDPRYLAIKGKEGDEVMVIPTVKAQKSQQRQALRVPYTAEVLMTAPKFSREADLDRDAELKVIAFYKAHPPQKLQSGSSSGQASQSATGQQASTSADQQASANKNAADFSDAERRDAATIRLREEQLKIGKKQVDAGGILLKKVVRTETVNKPVQLKREEFVIQRIPGSGEPVQNAQLGEREVFIPLTR